jgi:hypothetical protein
MSILTKNHDQLTAEVARHIAADSTHSAEQISYNNCIIFFPAHQQNNPQYIEDTYGIPLVLTRILEFIYVGLPTHNEAVEFFAAFPVAVANDGKDLTKVAWQFLVEVLKKIPQQPQEIQEVIDPVIAGLTLIVDGKEWNKDDALAALAAADDAWTAGIDAVEGATGAAHCAASYWAAYCAARVALAATQVADAGWAVREATLVADKSGVPIEWQRDLILRLIEEA